MAPGMPENVTEEFVRRRFEAMHELKKNPAKLRQMIDASAKKAKAANGQ